MGYRNREIEKKFVASFDSLDGALKTVKAAVKKWDHTVKGDSTDFYFDVPNALSADFARVRMMPNGKAQLTVKHQDKKNNQDRIEIDVMIDDPAQGIAFCTQLFGLAAKSVRKKYIVLFLDRSETNVSVYKVYGDKRFFLEVEARSKEKVNKVVEALSSEMELRPESRSVYQIFVQGRK